MWSLPCKYHFSSSLAGIRFHSRDQDLIHYDESLFTYRKSNRRTLITEAKSPRSFGQDGRAAANPNPGPSLTSRCLKCRFPPVYQSSWSDTETPQHCISRVATATYCKSGLLNQLIRRLPCHASFHIACGTDTDAPFTAAYLNTTPQQCQQSCHLPICLQCKEEWRKEEWYMLLFFWSCMI